MDILTYRDSLVRDFNLDIKPKSRPRLFNKFRQILFINSIKDILRIIRFFGFAMIGGY